MTGHHEGRFQSFMKAAGAPNPDLYEARQPEVDIVRGQSPASTTGTLTMEQLAVAHQKLGSGPQQRGVSLASTPKVGATYVNTGENFRTTAGFRLKVDLALIPPPPAGPLLINHYSHGGVSDGPAGTTPGGSEDTPRRIRTRRVPFMHESCTWSTSSRSGSSPSNHTPRRRTGTTIDLTTPLGTAASLFVSASRSLAEPSFERGFDQGLRLHANSAPADPNHTNGFKHARSFVGGWTAGKQAHHRRRGDAAAALGPRTSRCRSTSTTSRWRRRCPTASTTSIAWGISRVDQVLALIATGANLPH